MSVLLFAAVLISQSPQNRSSIVGTITDQSGAVISNAPVELKGDATGALWNTVSSVAGQYEIGNLDAGGYSLTVTVPGFKKYVATIALGANTRTRRDVLLEVGSVSESIAVASDKALLRTESSSVSRGKAPQAAPMLAIGGYARDAREQEYRRGPGIRGTRGSEEYGHFVENEFTTPTKDPLSTFSVDVDTASYSNARRFLNDRQLPPPESVRIEELVNYFSYDYALPEPGKPVSMTTNLMRSPWNSQRLLLHVGLRTQPVAAEDLPTSHLTFLVDVSGSMNSPDKLPLVQQALQMLTRQLRPQDTVSLVVYAGSSGVVLPPTRGSEQQRILEAIGRLQAGGSTNGAGGIRLAYQLARQSFDKRANNRVILATDGDFNVGVSSEDELVRLIEQERQSGVFLSVLGFGTGNLKDSKMEKLADHGNGNYAYIDSLGEARKVFVQQMGATLVTVAKDVKLQIEFNPAQVKEYRLVGYENRILRPEDFNNDAKDAGDLGAGHQVTAFYEIVPTGGIGSGDVDPLRYQEQGRRPARQTRSTELGWIKLRHKAPQGDKSELLQWPINANPGELRSASRDVRFAAAVAEYGLLLRRSKFAGDASFEHVLATATDAVGPDLAGYRTDFLDLVRRASALSGEHYSRR
ncbi:MAG: von Willebrand factor type A domain-containing protein [Bryobacteraceae bacterium]